MAFPLQNVTLPFFTGPVVAGYRNTASAVFEKSTDWWLNKERREDLREMLRRQSVDQQAVGQLELFLQDDSINKHAQNFLFLLSYISRWTEKVTRDANYRAGRKVALKAGLPTDAEIEREARATEDLVQREERLLDRYDPLKSADAFAERSMIQMSVDYGPTGRPRAARSRVPVVADLTKFKTFWFHVLTLQYEALLGTSRSWGSSSPGSRAPGGTGRRPRWRTWCRWPFWRGP